MLSAMGNSLLSSVCKAYQFLIVLTIGSFDFLLYFTIWTSSTYSILQWWIHPYVVTCNYLVTSKDFPHVSATVHYANFCHRCYLACLFTQRDQWIVLSSSIHIGPQSTVIYSSVAKVYLVNVPDSFFGNENLTTAPVACFSQACSCWHRIRSSGGVAGFDLHAMPEMRVSSDFWNCSLARDLLAPNIHCLSTVSSSMLSQSIHSFTLLLVHSIVILQIFQLCVSIIGACIS